MLSRETLMSIPLWVILLLPFGKIIATCLSIGTGGCGGLFGPGIVIGAFLGAALWRVGILFHLPGIPDNPDIFVIVTMMACFSSVSHTPIALISIVAEMMGSFAIIPGAVLTVGVSTFLMSPYVVTLYQAQQRDRRSATTHYRHYHDNSH